MERVLITGNNGFLGRKLESRLAGNYKVIGFSKKDGKDVTKKEDFEGLGADYVVHLAAITREKNKRDMFYTNVYGTMNVLEFCARNDCRLVFVSSCAVYGNQRSPIGERAKTTPASLYGLTKLRGEEICRDYLNVPSTILRVFNLYGPNQAKGFVIPDILSQLQNPEVRLGNPNPRRDFVYVEDVAEAIVKSLQSATPGIFNIGSGRSYSIREIAEKIAQKRKIRFKDNTPLESDIYANVERARDVLHWQAETSIDEGLKLCLSNQK